MIFLYNIKLFLKTKQLVISYLILLAISNFFLIWQLNYISLPFFTQYLSQSQNLGMIGFLFFSFMSYEYMFNTKRVGLEETLSTIKNGKFKVLLSKLLLLFVLIIAFALVILIYNAITYYSYNIHCAPFLLHIVKNIVLNILFVALIGALFGVLLSQYLKRVSAYIIMLIVSLIISPFFNEIALSLSLSYTEIYTFLDIFKILPPDLNWICDSLYGLSIEMIRWNIAYLWICVMSGIILLKFAHKRNYIIRCVCVLLIVLSIVNLTSYLFGNHDSVVRKDDRVNGVLFGDSYYWKEHENKIKEADYKVVKYDMTLDINRNMSAVVDITIEPSTSINTYSFTLYRGYTITSVTDESGNFLPYTRDGNYFDINKRFENEDTTITIKYEGTGNRFYSNSQGVALLGYFPYYPMAGHLKLWDQYTNSLYVNTNFETKEFNIVINSPLNIVSNLKKTGNNNFSGMSTTASLLGGFIAEDNKEGYNYTYSPVGKMDNYDFSGLEADWQKIRTLIGETRDLSFKNKKIMFVPLTIIGSSDAYNEYFVMLDDHILTACTSMGEMMYKQLESLIPYTSEKENLKSCFPSYLFGSFKTFSYDSVASYESLSILKNDLNDLEDSPEQIDKFFQMKEEFIKLFLYKIDKLGEEYVVKTVYRYLIDENDTTHEVDFLYNLE